MKHLFTLLLIAIGISSIHGQAMESLQRMSLGEYNSYTVVHQYADKKRAERKWKEYVKDFGKISYDKKKKEWIMEEAKIDYISNYEPLKVYMKIEEGKDQVKTIHFFDDGSGFVNSGDYPDESDRIKSFLADFQVLVAKDVVGEWVSNEENRLKGLEKDFSKLEKNHSKYLKEIEKAEKKIQEMEREIEKNLNEQDEKAYEIEKQKQEVQRMIDKLNSIERKIE